MKQSKSKRTRTPKVAVWKKSENQNPQKKTDESKNKDPVGSGNNGPHGFDDSDAEFQEEPTEDNEYNLDESPWMDRTRRVRLRIKTAAEADHGYPKRRLLTGQAHKVLMHKLKLVKLQ